MNIFIDEIVKEKLSQGREVENLGAWANMERMLDGKNPYQKNTQNKRRWLPLLFFIFIGAGAGFASIQYFGNKPNFEANNTEITTPNIANQTNLNNSTHTQNSFIENTNTIKHEKITTVSEGNNNGANTNANLTPNSSTKAINNDLKNNTPKKAKTAITKTHDNKDFSNNASNYKKTTTVADNKIKNVNPSTKSAKSKNNFDTYAGTKPSGIDSKNNKISDIPQFIEKLDTTEALYVKVNNRQDNLGIEKNWNDTMRKQIITKRTVINPRYVELTAQQKLDAERVTELFETKNSQVVNSTSTVVKPIEIKKEQIDPNIQLATNNENKTKRGFGNWMKKASTPLFDAMQRATIKIADKNITFYPGMVVGINSSFINSQHNFGGFQAGITTLTPLNHYLNLIFEARFMHKNNSGYTVEDFHKTVNNYNVDLQSIANTAIYNYQIDSTALGYNLKNMYSIQLPVLISASIRKFDVYAGPNIEYRLPMNVVPYSKKYVVAVSDTIPTNINYTTRGDISSVYAKSDFNSRFGIGYTIGGAYNFNSNLYLDLRMNNVAFDNSRTPARKTISDVFFKIPTVQFTLGYRFRSFDRDE